MAFLTSTRMSVLVLLTTACLELISASFDSSIPFDRTLFQQHTRKTAEAKAPFDKSDFLVQGLEEVEPAFANFDGEMYAGTLPFDNGGRQGRLMFWLFLPNGNTYNNNDSPYSFQDDSLVMWLNGGPGCSSLGAGVLYENSPVTIPLRPAGDCCVSKDEPLVYNPYAWTNVTKLLYIEQPISVGFSHAENDMEIPVDEDDVAGDVYAFLQHFYQLFPDLLTSTKVTIFGESYAGMYVPSIAHKIHRENLNPSSHKSVDIRLEGIGLGNGWVDARVQGPATIDYAYWHGMIDEHTRQNLHAEWKHCITHSDGVTDDDVIDSMEIDDDSEPKPFHKFNVPDDCGMMGAVLKASGHGVWPDYPAGPNTYDVTTWDPDDMIQPGNTTFGRFYNDPRVKEKLHAPPDIEWQICIPGAGRRRRRRRLQQRVGRLLGEGMLEQDRPISTLGYMADLLQGGIRVLVYNGDRDLSTNAQGSEMLLKSIQPAQWSGAAHWLSQPRGLWTVDKSGFVTEKEKNMDGPLVGGYAKEHQGLTFVVVYNSGHLVPFNVPLPALDLIYRFITDQSFQDYKLPSFNKAAAAAVKSEDAESAELSYQWSDGSYKPGSAWPSPGSVLSPNTTGGLWHTLSVLGVVILAFAAGYTTSACVAARNSKRQSYELIGSPST